MTQLPAGPSIDELERDPEFAELLRRLGAGNTLEQLKQLRHPLVTAVARYAGVDVVELGRLGDDTVASIINLRRAIRGLGKLGWAVTESQLPATAIDEAVRLLDAGATPATIDDHMTAAWNDGTWLSRSFAPMFTLTDLSDRETDVMMARQTLLDQAVRHHDAGDYAASVLLVLTQIDGLVFDVRGDRKGAFTAKADTFVDTMTVAGLPDNLRPAWQAIVRERYRTAATGRLERSPILHGRELGYGTKINSTKAFAFLRAIIEWLKPQAVAKRDAAEP
jgi:hypothetical protein